MAEHRGTFLLPDDHGARPAQLHLPVALASTSFAFLNFALPLRVAELGGGGLGVGAVFSVFTAFLLIARPMVGWGLDRFGRRPFLLAAMATYVLAMALYALWEGVAGLVVARAVQGAAAALLWVSVRTFVADHAPVAGRAQAMGRMTEVSVRGSLVGAALAITLVGVLGLETGWVSSFGLFGAAALVAAGLMWMRLPVGSGREAPRAGVPVSLPRVGPVDPLLLAVAAASTAGAVTFPFVILALIGASDGEMARLAVWLLPVAGVMAFLPSRAGRLADRFGAGSVVPAALALGVVACIVLALVQAPPLVVTGLVFVVAGTAAAEPAFAARAGGLETASRGRRFGRFELASGLGAVAGPLVGGLLHDHLGAAGPFWLAAGALVLALIVALRVLRRR